MERSPLSLVSEEEQVPAWRERGAFRQRNNIGGGSVTGERRGGQLWPEKRECFEFVVSALAVRYWWPLGTPLLSGFFLLCSRSWDRIRTKYNAFQSSVFQKWPPDGILSPFQGTLAATSALLYLEPAYGCLRASGLSALVYL